MTPEQQKLIQQLLFMGDITLFNRKRKTVVKAITEIDLESLTLILDDSITYQDTTKEIFLSKINELFEELRKTNTKLLAFNGKCNSVHCPNLNKKGMLFCGNTTGKHFNLIIEEDDNDNISDLYYCHDFVCESKGESKKSGKSLSIKIFEDEKVDFKPSSHYDYINTTSLKALADLQQFKDKSISKNDLQLWHDRYFDFYDSMVIYRLKYKYQDEFYHCFYRIHHLVKYLILEDNCTKAMQLFDSILIEDEMNLLKWLAEHEDLKDDFILFSPDYVDENTVELKYIIVNNALDISISTDYLKNGIRFKDIVESHYYEFLNKYKIYADDDESTPFDDDFDNRNSLKYQLEQRNLLVNKISYKFKLGKNRFLNNAENFGRLEDGVEMD